MRHACREKSDDGAEAEDANRQRESDEEHHVTRKCSQVVEIARRELSGWSLAPSFVPLCCLWICRISNHPKYQNGLKMRRKEDATVTLNATYCLQLIAMQKRDWQIVLTDYEKEGRCHRKQNVYS